MSQTDSVDKIVLSYLAAITTHPFTYRDQRILPRPLKFNGNLLRGFTCPAGCGGCCPRFSLDYLPSEEKPYNLTPREIEFDGRQVLLWSDTQTDHKASRCRNLKSDGRCGIHGKQPFSCDFELIRFIYVSDHWTVSERLFGRGWAMKRTDGGVGALCTITKADSEAALDVARRFNRLAEWADHFGLRNHRARTLAKYATRYSLEPHKAPAMSI